VTGLFSRRKLLADWPMPIPGPQELSCTDHQTFSQPHSTKRITS
jgi:hypothetical protein